MNVDVARYRELAIQRITYTHDEHGTAKLSAALHLTQQALTEAAAALTASEAERARLKAEVATLIDQRDSLLRDMQASEKARDEDRYE